MLYEVITIGPGYRAQGPHRHLVTVGSRSETKRPDDRFPAAADRGRAGRRLSFPLPWKQCPQFFSRSLVGNARAAAVIVDD